LERETAVEIEGGGICYGDLYSFTASLPDHQFHERRYRCLETAEKGTVSRGKTQPGERAVVAAM
jgi:hypothetical protein